MRANMELIAELRQWIEESRSTVFFGGAGVSTDSGLADFRSRKSGLYHQKSPYSLPPDRILSHEFYSTQPEAFFEYYRKKLLNLKARPNYVHYALADMERQGKLSAIVTQNADGLHRQAGSRNVIDIHGSVYVNTCERCGKRHSVKEVAYCEGVPHCECGGIIRPGIVLFDEIPDMGNVMRAVSAFHSAELLIIAGTSLRISSTTKLIKSFRGKHLAIINDEETACDDEADLVIHDRLTPAFQSLWPMEHWMEVPEKAGNSKEMAEEDNGHPCE